MPKAKSTKEIIDKTDFIKLKTSDLQKTMSREEENKSEWDKIFIKDTSDKE